MRGATGKSHRRCALSLAEKEVKPKETMRNENAKFKYTLNAYVAFSHEHVMVYVEVCSSLVPWSPGTYKHVTNARCDIRASLHGQCLAMTAFHSMMHQNWIV